MYQQLKANAYSYPLQFQFLAFNVSPQYTTQVSHKQYQIPKLSSWNFFWSTMIVIQLSNSEPMHKQGLDLIITQIKNNSTSNCEWHFCLFGFVPSIGHWSLNCQLQHSLSVGPEKIHRQKIKVRCWSLGRLPPFTRSMPVYKAPFSCCPVFKFILT